MLHFIYVMLLSVVATIGAIVIVLGLLYWTMLLLSLVTGLLGLDRVAHFFRRGVDGINTRVKKTVSIILKTKENKV